MDTIAIDRKQTAFRLRKDLLERLKIEARKENKNLEKLNLDTFEDFVKSLE